MLRFRQRRINRRIKLVQALTETILKDADLQRAFNEIEHPEEFIERLKQQIEKYPRTMEIS